MGQVSQEKAMATVPATTVRTRGLSTTSSLRLWSGPLRPDSGRAELLGLVVFTRRDVEGG